MCYHKSHIIIIKNLHKYEEEWSTTLLDQNVSIIKICLTIYCSCNLILFCFNLLFISLRIFPGQWDFTGDRICFHYNYFWINFILFHTKSYLLVVYLCLFHSISSFQICCFTISYLILQELRKVEKIVHAGKFSVCSYQGEWARSF